MEKAVNGLRKSGLIEYPLNRNIFGRTDFTHDIVEEDADVEKNAQEPTVRFNIKSANQPTVSSDFNEASHPINLQWHLLVFPPSSLMKHHHPLQLHRRLQRT